MFVTTALGVLVLLTLILSMVPCPVSPVTVRARQVSPQVRHHQL
jgi:hypothetical protein